MNLIVAENGRTDGRMTAEYWDVPHSCLIEGFTTDFSVAPGEVVAFKINIDGAMPASAYRIEIFRMGHYGGSGGRRVAVLLNPAGTVQPPAIFCAKTGTWSAETWHVTDHWAVPEDAVSGIYLARLQRLDFAGAPVEGAVNQIPFVLRDDHGRHDLLLQTDDTTWQAYNGWAGNNGRVGANFYGDAAGDVRHKRPRDPGLGAPNRAFAVSYDRPFITRNGASPASGAQDYLFGATYAALYWLESLGFDVTYQSGIDTHRLGRSWYLDDAGERRIGAYVSVGHDEYWSGPQRANVEAARDAGVHLMFWTGNEIYWRTRFETDAMTGETDFRTLICYKETWGNADPEARPGDYAGLDPSDQWTGTWRDLRFVDAVDDAGRPRARGAMPEHALTGQAFVGEGPPYGSGVVTVPSDMQRLRFWRDTCAAEGEAVVARGIIGYEFDTSPDDAFTPPGLLRLSRSTIRNESLLFDAGNLIAGGVTRHSLTLYRAKSGAMVFAAGSVFWAWGLCDLHDSSPYGGRFRSRAIEQFTLNLLADIGIQPSVGDATLAAEGLVRAHPSTDARPAVATLDPLPKEVEALQPIEITGSASDETGDPEAPGGGVALVELSFDGGSSWQGAEGTTHWRYRWVPRVRGRITVMVRAIDDSLNLPPDRALPRQVVTVVRPRKPDSFSLHAPHEAIPQFLHATLRATQVGMRFRAAANGQVTALKYYRSPLVSTGSERLRGGLWMGRTLLGNVVFSPDPARNGWQVAELTPPVPIRANCTYVISCESGPVHVVQTVPVEVGATGSPGMLSFPLRRGRVCGVFTRSRQFRRPWRTLRTMRCLVDLTFVPTDEDHTLSPVAPRSRRSRLLSGLLALGFLAALRDTVLNWF